MLSEIIDLHSEFDCTVHAATAFSSELISLSIIGFRPGKEANFRFFIAPSIYFSHLSRKFLIFREIFFFINLLMVSMLPAPTLFLFSAGFMVELLCSFWVMSTSCTANSFELRQQEETIFSLIFPIDIMNRFQIKNLDSYQSQNLLIYNLRLHVHSF